MKTVSISWFIQKSGNYALKGVTVVEDGRAYDSTGTFREEDAKWLSELLAADIHVELSGNNMGGRSSEGYPEWAQRPTLPLPTKK